MAKTEIQESVEKLYARGRLSEAMQLLSEAIAKQENSSLWNDWGCRADCACRTRLSPRPGA